MQSKNIYGYFSQKAASTIGFVVYRDEFGLDIKVTEVVSEGVKPLSKYNDLVYVGKVKTFIRNNMKDYSNLSISDLLDIANERNNEVIKCNKQFKKTNKCFCATCPINNKN